jgi:hypothetical protein
LQRCTQAARTSQKEVEAAEKKESEAAAAQNQKTDAAAAKTDACEIDGLAEAIARTDLGAAVLANAAAWIAAAGARSVAKLEKDDIDGALS